MEYIYVNCEDSKYQFWDQSFGCWVKTENEATVFTLDDRMVIEKHGFLTGGSFVKVRT
jgi:hypothetical protein